MLFSSYAVLDRNASAACQNLGFLTKSSSIVHFTETSVRVATSKQIRTRLPLTSPIYFLKYEGTSSCKVYVPLKYGWGRGVTVRHERLRTGVLESDEDRA